MMLAPLFNLMVALESQATYNSPVTDQVIRSTSDVIKSSIVASAFVSPGEVNVPTLALSRIAHVLVRTRSMLVEPDSTGGSTCASLPHLVLTAGMNRLPILLHRQHPYKHFRRLLLHQHALVEVADLEFGKCPCRCLHVLAQSVEVDAPSGTLPCFLVDDSDQESIVEDPADTSDQLIVESTDFRMYFDSYGVEFGYIDLYRPERIDNEGGTRRSHTRFLLKTTTFLGTLQNKDILPRIAYNDAAFSPTQTGPQKGLIPRIAKIIRKCFDSKRRDIEEDFETATCPHLTPLALQLCEENPWECAMRSEAFLDREEARGRAAVIVLLPVSHWAYFNLRRKDVDDINPFQSRELTNNEVQIFIVRGMGDQGFVR
ncbi:hypothetical protein BD410DRAFT_806789 [Rickenella mellea]|uniref:Uncharacterized protein n=1 Tax=Rickenella mellea TaxID=50990 RepID=A0A4Y7PRU7_9AGAM|nr:hypothetical protein BD410DRAFT_806789 [Rickenella mellea]